MARAFDLDPFDDRAGLAVPPDLVAQVGIIRVGGGQRAAAAAVGGRELLQPLSWRWEVDSRGIHRADAAVDRHERIGAAVDLQHGAGLSVAALVDEERARLHRDGDDLVGELAGQAQAHHRPVRVARCKDALLVNVVFALDLVDQQRDEADVVHVVELLLGRAATAAGVPDAPARLV